MTRTTLLQLLAHPAALSGADVHELEQLAQAFPYCQTAHLLLAKAAHDQGSMLAGQRLRRAATYAADRARLRQLIELAPMPELLEPELATVPELSLVTTEKLVTTAGPALTEAAPLLTLAATEPAELLAAPAEDEAEAEPAELALPEAEPAEPAPAEATADNLLAALPTPDHLAEPALAAEPEEVTEVTETAPETEEAEPEEELPAQAPPIRPPAEAERAHAEYGLAEAEPTEISAYSLPTLPEVELPLGITVDVLSKPLPAFKGDPDVGYAPTEGSRLGFCLQGLATEYSLLTGPAALLPSTVLPPTSEFFAPDALVLAHLVTHQLPTPAPDASDLIDSFLRRSPQGAARRRSFSAHHQALDEEQTDLSGPSTRVVPDLASENLAQILVRQGKIERAIAIYERLMVKHPEKMAYFAAQIDSLRPSA